MGFFSRNHKKEFRTLNIGEGRLTITIPSHYLTEIEGDLLLIYPSGEEIITLRVAVLGITKNGIFDAAYQAVLEDAQLQNLSHQIIRDGVALLEETPYETVEQGIPILMQVWKIGYKTSLIIVTSTIIKELSTAESAKLLLAELPAIFKTIIEK